MIGLRAGWRQIKRASAVKSVLPDMWRAINKLAVAKQSGNLELGFCSLCGFRVETHAPDCVVQDAKAIVEIVRTRAA